MTLTDAGHDLSASKTLMNHHKFNHEYQKLKFISSKYWH